MFACLFFGDSLALGTAAAVNARYPRHCEVRAVTGAASTAMLRWVPPTGTFDTAILSIGSNDDIGRQGRSGIAGPPATSDRQRRERAFANIALLRRNLPSRRVIWMLPYDRRRAAIVQAIAVSYDDEVLDVAMFATRDHLHPRDYGAVARQLLR